MKKKHRQKVGLTEETIKKNLLIFKPKMLIREETEPEDNEPQNYGTQDEENPENSEDQDGQDNSEEDGNNEAEDPEDGEDTQDDEGKVSKITKRRAGES